MVNECSCQTAQISIKYGRVVPKFFEQRAVLNDIVFSYSWGVGGGGGGGAEMTLTSQSVIVTLSDL